jgi:hypothetical protein
MIYHISHISYISFFNCCGAYLYLKIINLTPNTLITYVTNVVVFLLVRKVSISPDF